MYVYYKYFYTDDDGIDSNRDFWANFTNVYTNQDNFTASYEAVGKCLFGNPIHVSYLYHNKWSHEYDVFTLQRTCLLRLY